MNPKTVTKPDYGPDRVVGRTLTGRGQAAYRSRRAHGVGAWRGRGCGWPASGYFGNGAVAGVPQRGRRAGVMKTGQVFVSHTSDMARFPADRSFAQGALDAVARAGMTPVDMRYFAARDDAPADYCRARVRECEIFVAVIGFRYGSMVPGEGISYTELEFEAATDAGMPRLVFLLEEAVSLPEGQADVDLGRVEAFRQRLRDAAMVVRAFTSDAGLELEVFHALTEVTGQFGERRREIAGYLRALIGWVNTDPWPRDRRFGGPVLTPSAIERKLRVSALGRAGEEELDAADLARQCQRLVVLGGPGSGKTWLAKRTARCCAERALEAMAAGAGLDEVELPLYTTCSRLFSAEGDIREAAVTSALEQLGDLGGPGASADLREFFAGRNAPTLLVIDSLDEAHGSQQRLRQADTLPWRIVLTTRPSSWNQQLAIDDTDDSHRVGELQPLRYPEDVEPFVRRWFDHQPERGEELAAEIARRPDLHQAATVPLILAFYCIVGGREPLPEFRRDLYGRVLNRVLTGRWRGEDCQPDIGACLQRLRDWAWPAAQASHPVSGIGIWTDDILTEHAGLGEAEQHALDHVAMPLGPADVDTGKTLRRFIHRSIREHLVADYVARLPASQAAGELLSHCWHDPDWEYSAPAAIAMHPQRDQLLRELICQAARSEQLPEDLSIIDAGWDFRGLLARVVSESGEADWSPEIAEMISRARVDLARSGHIDALGGPALWAHSNRLIRDALLKMLAEPRNGWAVGTLVAGVLQLATTEEDKRHACDALIGLLPSQGSSYEAARFTGEVVGGVAQLAPTARDKRKIRRVLLALLRGESDIWVADELVEGVSQLSPTAYDKRQARDALIGLIPGQPGGWETVWLVDRVVRLATTNGEKRETADILLGLLPGQPGSWVADEISACIGRLSPAAEDNRRVHDSLPAMPPCNAETSTTGEPASWVTWRAQAATDSGQVRSRLLRALAGETNGRAATGLAAAVSCANPTAEEKRQAREVLLGLLVSETDGRTAAELVGIVSRLGPTSEEKRHARETLLPLLAIQSHGNPALWLADGIIQAGPSAEEKRQARDALLKLLAIQCNERQVARLANRISRLDPTAEDKRQIRETLLRSLAGPVGAALAAQLVGLVSRLDPTPDDKRQARAALLRLLAVQTDGRAALELTGLVSRLGPTPEDKRQVREALLRPLADQTDSSLVSGLLGSLVQLAATADDKHQTRDALIRLLASHPDGPLASGLLSCVTQLAAAAQGERQTTTALLRLLRQAPVGARETAGLVGAVVQLAATAEDKRRALGKVLNVLAAQADGWKACELTAGVIQLDPSAQDKLRARNALLALLRGQTSGPLAARLMDALAQLDPTASDINDWRGWEALPTVNLVAAVRRNSELTAWLAVLPDLAPLSASPFRDTKRPTTASPAGLAGLIDGGETCAIGVGGQLGAVSSVEMDLEDRIADS
jgi:Domain of unknown function (DUF4062)/NACHT domain